MYLERLSLRVELRSVALTLVAASAFIAMTQRPAVALDLKPAEIRAKIDEKPVAVLQKRFFSKALRPEFGLLTGAMLNEAYTSTEKRGARLGLFFTEWVGIEAQYVDTSVSNSADRKALERLKFKKEKPEPGDDPNLLVSPEPEVNPVHQIIDFNGVFAPFYGKLNMLDYFIVYMDTYVTFGGAKVKTAQGDKGALSLGLGQRFYFLKSLSLRVDFRNHTFSETRNNEKSRRNVQSWDVGLSWFFL